MSQDNTHYLLRKILYYFINWLYFKGERGVCLFFVFMGRVIRWMCLIWSFYLNCTLVYGQGVDSSSDAWTMCLGHYEVKSPIHENFTADNKCIHTNGGLENGLMYSYKVLESNVVNASPACTTYKSWMKEAFVTFTNYLHFPMRKPVNVLFLHNM